jgi:hypothetical protein
MAGGGLSAAEQVADWLYPAEQRIRRGELSAKFRDRPRQRRRLELRGPVVGPGMPTLADAIPPRPFLGDTIYIPKDVADAFDMNAITVGNLAQTKPGPPLSAAVCSPFAQVRLNDWCPPGVPVRIRAINVSDKPAAFCCEFEGDEPVADDAEVRFYAASDVGEQALSVRHRLNDHAAAIEPLAREALGLFKAAGLLAQARWLSLELNGYATLTEARALHEVLSLPLGDRLVVQVKTYLRSHDVRSSERRSRPASTPWRWRWRTSTSLRNALAPRSERSCASSVPRLRVS